MKKSLSGLIIFVLLATSSYAQVAINYDGSSPTTHSILDIKSDSTGLLIPRMTSTQRGVLAYYLNNTHEGMIVF